MNGKNSNQKAKEVLWEMLQLRRPNGQKFVSGHKLKTYLEDGSLILFTAECYCVEEKLIIEVDREIKELNKERLAAFKYLLREKGIRVLRFKESEILTNPEYVFNIILSNTVPTPVVSSIGLLNNMSSVASQGVLG